MQISASLRIILTVILGLMGQGGGGLDPATASALLPQLGLGGGSDAGISS